MKKLTVEFNEELPDINIVPGKCSECPFFMSRSHFLYGKEEIEYICILTGDNIDEDIYYYENIKYTNCPIKEVQMANCEKKSKDNINPNHYKSETSLECIEAMQIAFGNDAVIDFCLCNAWKYIWRWENKNGIEDLKKAEWYIEKGRELLGNHLEFESTNRHQSYQKNMKMLWSALKMEKSRKHTTLIRNGVYERDFEDLWEKVSQKMKSNNQIFKKNIIIQHTCGNCKHEKIPENEYPCRLCMHGADYRSDLWRAKEDE